MRIYCMQLRTCLVWNWYGIVEFHLRLQFYSIPFLIETPSLAFSTNSLLKVPNSRIIPTLTFQFQSPGPDPSRRNYWYVSVPTVIKWVCSTNGLRRISQHLISFCMGACIKSPPPPPPSPELSTGFYPDVQQSPAFSLTQLGNSA